MRAMKRFILRYRGEGSKPEADVARIRALPDLTVLDDSSSRMLLVESTEKELRELMEGLPDWKMSPEQLIELPDPRPRLRH